MAHLPNTSSLRAAATRPFYVPPFTHHSTASRAAVTRLVSPHPQARYCCELPHRSQVWRVEWNSLGGMLASSEDDGTLHLFRIERRGAGRCVARRVGGGGCRAPAADTYCNTA